MLTTNETRTIVEMMMDEELWELVIEKARAKANPIPRRVLNKWQDPKRRMEFILKLINNEFESRPDHRGFVEKDDANDPWRRVSIGEHDERILYTLSNECCNRRLPYLIYPTSVAYQKGKGTQRYVTQYSYALQKFLKENPDAKYVAFKSDYSKFFDRAKRKSVFKCFDLIEREQGFELNADPFTNWHRKTFSDDRFFEKDKVGGEEYLTESWRGIRQGNAMASFLANILLYDVDEYMTNNYEYYIRYSDDSLVLTTEPWKAIEDINRLSSKHGIILNEKKTEFVTRDEFVKFLGFSIKGEYVTLSKNRLDRFNDTIKELTIKKIPQGITYEKALKDVYNFLYKGDGNGHSWATSVFQAFHCPHDMEYMNRLVMDCLRAVKLGRCKGMYSLGYDKYGKEGVIPFNKGTTVGTNRERCPYLEGYDTMLHWYNMYHKDIDVYKAKVRCL